MNERMPGKLEPDVLKDKVLSFTGALRDDLIVGGGVGEDAALIRVPEGILVAASDPVTGAGKNAGRLLVHINANDIACKGADPSWIIVTLIVPDKLGVKYIAEIMNEIHSTCSELNIAIAGGHTELTDRYEQPVLSATMLGMTHYELSTKRIREGDLILLTGHAGLEGMSIIAHDRPDLFTGIFTPDEMKEIQSWQNDLSVIKPAKILREYSHYMHDPTEGGLNGALYETSKGCNLGIEIYEDNLPVLDLTCRASEALNFNPMNLISSGMLIAVIPPERIDEAQERLRDNDIDSCIAGKFVRGKENMLNTHEELWQILAL
ncbi:MAG: AIR synthase family protein [Synergistaceae bacterium]|nr:AIR synthase family protein [Synergistaceae bacterium]